MPNLVKEFRVEVGFLLGGGGGKRGKKPPAQLELKITMRKIELSVLHACFVTGSLLCRGVSA